MRQAFRAAQEPHLQPALAQAFDAFSHEGDLHLARLEVHLSVTQSDHLVEDVLKQLVESVQKALAQQAVEQASANPPSKAERLLHYLRHGEATWQDAHLSSDALRQLLMAEAAYWLSSATQDWAHMVAQLPAQPENRLHAFQRLLALLDQPARMSWLMLAESQASARMKPVVASTAALVDSGVIASRDVLDAISTLALCMASSPDDAWLSLATEVKNRLRDSASPALETFWKQLEIALAFPALNKQSALRTVKSRRQPYSKTDDSSDAPQPSLPDAFKEEPDADPSLGIPLRSAGLVLLHPWLTPLFSALGWIPAQPAQGEPFPAQSLAKALHLLHWLATGRHDPLEFELGTPKLLLGLAPGMPVHVGAAPLDAATLEEGQALLEAMIGHWPALGKISVPGLQTAFLQRGGLLYLQPGSPPLLRLQPESYDMLLERLPWSIGIIRLPWRQQALHVEWGTP